MFLPERISRFDACVTSFCSCLLTTSAQAQVLQFETFHKRQAFFTLNALHVLTHPLTLGRVRFTGLCRTRMRSSGTRWTRWAGPGSRTTTPEATPTGRSWTRTVAPTSRSVQSETCVCRIRPQGGDTHTHTHTTSRERETDRERDTHTHTHK